MNSQSPKAYAGLDEVGRGALAGPVAVGAVALFGDGAGLVAELLAAAHLRRLTDSKKMSRAQRERAFSYLEGKVTWAVGTAEAWEIDALGLAAALRLAAGRALDGVRQQGIDLERVEADAGLFHPYEAELPTARTVKGDETVPAISLASIMAKVWRDRCMAGLDGECPGYGWITNVGYGTKLHYDSIRRLGRSPQHRRSFLTGLVA